MKTNTKFKVGDKVYVYPGKYSSFKFYIRATITDIDNTLYGGYFLKAFEKDLPGIWMFNIYDRDLIIRYNKTNKSIDETLHPDILYPEWRI